jgi:hypothetical protein
MGRKPIFSAHQIAEIRLREANGESVPAIGPGDLFGPMPERPRGMSICFTWVRTVCWNGGSVRLMTCEPVGVLSNILER